MAKDSKDDQVRIVHYVNEIKRHFKELKDKVGTLKKRTSTAKKAGSSNAKDTSGKLKKIHGRSRKALTRKRRKSDWHKDFYKNAPRNRVQRLLWLLHPRRQFRYWFSKHGLKIMGMIAAIGLGLFVIVVLGLYAYFSRELPGREEITNRVIQETTKFYDRSGEVLLYEVYGDENRTVVKFDEISDYAKKATVAIEDRNFYNHNGISLSGITRAAYQNLFNTTQYTPGGSTITQQFVKNSLLTNEKTYERKIKEAILAIELERIYNKDEILSFYLNEVPYGGVTYGIQSAAKNYFAKDAIDLSLDESALLAAMIQRPTFYSPTGDNTDLLIDRRDTIIGLMQEQGYITSEEADAAKEVDTLAKITSDGLQERDITAPHFVLEVQRQLEEQYGADQVVKGGLKVITTIDLDLQEVAEKAVTDNIERIDAAGGNNAALVSTDPNTGQVLAMVGSRDYDYPKFGNFNAALSRRQPGSSFKPYEYATLIDQQNYGAGSIFYDVPTDFGGGYEPGNFDGRYSVNQTIREHIAESRNVPAVKVLYIAGIENVIEQVESMGASIDGDADSYGLSLALGAAELKLAEHVHGYATFATGGITHDQAYILKVTNSVGEVLEEWQEAEGERTLNEETAYIMTDILSDNNARRDSFGSGRYFIINGVDQIAAKTGTTNSRRDGWLVGYTKSITGGVWVGHSENNTMNSGTYRLTGPMWQQFMTDAHKLDAYANPGTYERPDGVKSVTLDKITGRRPVDGSSAPTVTDIFPASYKAARSDISDPFDIDTISNKLATDCTPDRARKTVRVGGVTAEIPPSDPSYNRWIAPIKRYLGNRGGEGIAVKPTEEDDVHKCSDKSPKITQISTEAAGDKTKIIVSVTEGTFDLESLDIRVDGQIASGGAKQITSSGDYSVTVSLSNGEHTAEAVVIDEGLYDDEASKSFTVSNAGGSGSFSALSPSGVQTGDATFSWDELDGADNGYTLYIDDVVVGSTSDEDDTSLTIDDSQISNGSHTWYVVANLGGGSTQKSSEQTFQHVGI